MLLKIKKIYNVLTALVVTAVVILALLLVGVRLFGLKPYTVLSGSMEPRYHVGSVIYVEEVDPLKLQVGDALTFNHGGSVVTHQIVEIIGADNPYNMKFVTQGLTNNITDGEIPVSCIIGRPVYSIPKLGYVAEYFSNPTGLIGIVCVIVLLFVISLILDFFTKEKADEKPSSYSDRPNDPEGGTDEDINKNKED